MSASVSIWWIPLGAGGRFVAFNGRMYERWCAWREHRSPAPLFHAALEIKVPEGRFMIETAWPIPDGDGADRGVVAEGPVFARFLGRFRLLRYEVRKWPDGTTDDAAFVASQPIVSRDLAAARRVLALVPSVPPRVWGRDRDGVGDMWNSNSLVSWLLTMAAIPIEGVRPPSLGRAPGWAAGIAVARRMLASQRRVA